MRISWQPAKQRYGDELHAVREDTARLREQMERTVALLGPPPPPRAREPRAHPAKQPPRALDHPRGPERARVDARDVKGLSKAEDEDEEEEEIIRAVDMLAQTRRAVVAHLREQTALKQSLLELNDQNTRNRIEISKLRVRH